MSDFSKKYHFHWWCHRQHHLQLKRESLYLTIFCLIILTAGQIAGPIVQNVWVMGGLTWLSVILKGILDYRKYESKINLTRVAYTSYAKCLAQGDNLDEQEMLWTHAAMIDLAPVIPDKIRHKYGEYTDFTDHVDGIKTESILTLHEFPIPSCIVNDADGAGPKNDEESEHDADNMDKDLECSLIS